MSKKDLGKKGEQLAKQLLQQKGYTILASNWRSGRYEIDIIAQKTADVVVFVEVKTRSTDYFGYPEIQLSLAQKKRIAKAAEAYLYEHQLDVEVRFDIIALTISSHQTKTYHIEDAFFLYDE